MLRRVFLLSFLLLIFSESYGQDVITRSDGAVLKVNILEVLPNQINFKLYQQPDTLIYQISTQDVQSIQKADGTTKIFKQDPATQKNRNTFNYETTSGRNILWLYPFDVLFSNFSFAYERISTSGKIGFKIPLVVGFSSNSPDEYYDNYNAFRNNNRIGAGLDVNFYPFGQGRLQYYLGPGFHFRSYQNSYYFYDEINMQSEYRRQNETMYFLTLKNGIYFQLSKSLIISGDVGVGVRFFKQPEEQPFYRQTRLAIPGNFHFGFRF